MFDLKDAAGVLAEVNECRKAKPEHYIRLNAYDASYGKQTTVLQFIVGRPSEEPHARPHRKRAREESSGEHFHQQTVK